MCWEFSQQSMQEDQIQKDPLFHTPKKKQVNFLALLHLSEHPQTGGF